MMRSLLLLLIDALTMLARLLGPGSPRSMVAESLLLKHQLLVLMSSNESAFHAPLSAEAIRVLRRQQGRHPRYMPTLFTYIMFRTSYLYVL